MSLEYPCVYWNNGKCKKFSEDGIESWCVEGPCGEMRPSNADRIRAMSDEELACLLAHETYRIAKPVFDLAKTEIKEDEIYCLRLEWLKQPAEVEK